MGNCVPSRSKNAMNEEMNTVLSSLVKVAVSDWFLIASHFDDLPDTIQNVLLGDVLLTCDYIFEKARWIIERSQDEQKQENKKFPQVKRALTFMIQWFHFILSQSQISESYHTKLQSKIIQTSIYIMECDETYSYQKEMDHVRISALRLLQQYAQQDEKIVTKIATWNEQHTSTQSQESESPSSSELHQGKREPPSPQSLTTLFLQQRQQYQHFKQEEITWNKAFTDPLPLTHKKWITLTHCFPQPPVVSEKKESSRWTPEFPLVVKDAFLQVTNRNSQGMYVK